MRARKLQVDFWDVGYGDATVVWLTDRRLIIVDCGPSNSRLPKWIEKHGFDVDLVILTHNDADHFEGFLSLMRIHGLHVKAYAWVQDRSAEDLRRVWKELKDGHDRLHWPEPILIAPRAGKSYDLLAAAEIPKHRFSDSLKIEALYPSHLDNLAGQAKGPNWAGALIVLTLGGVPLVAWPGDLPLATCRDVLTGFNIKPIFLVGPHHGGPIDLARLTEDQVNNFVHEIGHCEAWISVAWNRKYQHPRPEYLRPISQRGITLRCSQITPRCDPDLHLWEEGIIPTHDWLGLEPPPSGPSCMGAMRVLFSADEYQVQFALVHAEARSKLQHPLCLSV